MEDIIMKDAQSRSRILNIINNVAAEYQLRHTGQQNIYCDEPIVKTAAQLNNYTPEPILEMRRIANFHSLSAQELFYKQGMYMAEFVDNYDRPIIGDKIIYRYPTYHSMRDRELRQYFTWRSKVRKCNNVITDIPAFLFLYVYEILNLIGFDTPMQAFEEYKKIYDIYKSREGIIRPYLDIWYRDFVVYYNLNSDLLSCLDDFRRWDNIQILCRPENYNDGELFNAIIQLSDYKIEKSAFYKKYTEELIVSVCSSYRLLTQQYRDSKRLLITDLFGNKKQQAIFLFSGAVFYDKQRIRDYKYSAQDTFDMECRQGRWHIQYYDIKPKNKKIGNFVKYTEWVLRSKFSYNNFKDVPFVPDEYKSAVDICIRQYIEARRQQLIPKINIDLSKLSNIRKNADITMNRLIVDDMQEEIIGAEQGLNQNISSDSPDAHECMLLSEAESCFIRLLLNGKPYAGYIKDNKLLLSVVIDGINEKLFEIFQDTVIISDGDVPVIIEDYIEELKGFVC